jgi:CMP-N-acetylneuraminic acid synthetase
MIVAIHTSRQGSVGVVGKNTLLVRDRPLFQYGLLACANCKSIDKTLAATDIPEVLDYARSLDLLPLVLSPELANGNHYQTIRYAAERALEFNDVSIFVIVLGNSLGATSEALNGSVARLLEDEGLDSVSSVSTFPMFNPLRAYVERGGLLSPQVSAQHIVVSGPVNERASVEVPWFFNGSFWVVRKKSLLANAGPPPFPWLGNRIAAFHQPPIMELDEPWQIPLMQTFI